MHEIWKRKPQFEHKQHNVFNITIAIYRQCVAPILSRPGRSAMRYTLPKTKRQWKRNIQTENHTHTISPHQHFYNRPIQTYIRTNNTCKDQAKKNQEEKPNQIILVWDSWCWASALCRNQSHKATPKSSHCSCCNHPIHTRYCICVCVLLYIYIRYILYEKNSLTTLIPHIRIL